MIVGACFNRPARWVSSAVILHMLALMPVFITERYRMAAVPGLLILGSFGAAWLVVSARDRRWARALLYGGSICMAIAIVVLPKPLGPRSMEPYNLAIAAMEVGQLDRAMRHLQEAEAMAPGASEISQSMGAIYLREGDKEHAKACFARTLQRDPHNNEALSNLGLIAMMERRWDWAKRFFSMAIASKSNDWQSYFLLAQANLNDGNREEARRAIDGALSLKPRDPQLLQFRQGLLAPDRSSEH
jgi:tetratricopeptide (TPR) repeat protein